MAVNLDALRARRMPANTDHPDALCLDAADEIERLRAALEACSADYISKPCTVVQGYSLVAEEFSRRMEIAARALHPSVPADKEQR